jgi:hypothetical protein
MAEYQNNQSTATTSQEQTPATEFTEEPGAGPSSFTSHGAVPPVKPGWSQPKQSPSDRAYGAPGGEAPAGHAGEEYFGSPEHQAYGNEGAKNAGYTGTYDPPKKQKDIPFTLTHGDIVMLSGDYFDPRDKDEKGHPVPDNLFALANTPSSNLGHQVGTRDEILAAMKEANPADPRFAKEGVWGHIQFSDDVQNAMHSRYLRLAAVNYEHFANPRGAGSGGPASGNRHSAGGSYRALHEGAIDMAHQAKKDGKDVNDAMAHEAAAEHFLTDGFAAGHLRTPRQSIKEHWDAKYPLFFENLKKTIAQDVSIYINGNETNIATVGGSVLDIEESILPAIDDATKALPPIGIGDIVSGLEHDVDNAEGLLVTNDLGEHWRTFGDSHGGVLDPSNKAQQDTKTHVEQAVQLGIADVMHAHAVDPAASAADVQSEVRAQTPAPAIANRPKYGPEQEMPVLDPSAPASENGTQGWEQPSFAALWDAPVRTGDHGKKFSDLIKASAKGGDIHDQISDLASKFPTVQSTHWSHVHPRAAYLNGFVNELQANPKAKIQSIIDYDPGKGQAGSRTDDATREDMDRLEDQGQKQSGDRLARLRGLTLNERVHYVTNLESFRGWTTSQNEGEKIFELFETAAPGERRAMFYALSGDPWSGSLKSSGHDLWMNLDDSQRTRLTQLLNASP